MVFDFWGIYNNSFTRFCYDSDKLFKKIFLDPFENSFDIISMWIISNEFSKEFSKLIYKYFLRLYLSEFILSWVLRESSVYTWICGFKSVILYTLKVVFLCEECFLFCTKIKKFWLKSAHNRLFLYIRGYIRRLRLPPSTRTVICS